MRSEGTLGAVWKINVLQQGLLWIDRKLEVNFQITASTCSGFYSFTSQHKHCHSIAEMWWKDQGAHLESGAVPALPILSGARCMPQQRCGLGCPHTLQSPPTASSSLLRFVSRASKGREEAVLFWQKSRFSGYLVLKNPTHLRLVLQQWWLTWTAATSLLTQKEPRNCNEKEQEDQHIQASQREARLILNSTKYIKKSKYETIKYTIRKTKYMLTYSCHTIPQHYTQSSSIFVDFIW